MYNTLLELYLHDFVHEVDVTVSWFFCELICAIHGRLFCDHLSNGLIRSHVSKCSPHCCYLNEASCILQDKVCCVFSLECTGVRSNSPYISNCYWYVLSLVTGFSFVTFSSVYSATSFNHIPRVFWCCWFGDRKDIQPVKITAIAICKSLVLVNRLNVE